jgi:hypothetical protein
VGIVRKLCNKAPKTILVVSFFIGLSFLLTWPIMLFVNYIIGEMGSVFSFKLWQFWLLLLTINLVFKRATK